MCWLQTGVQSLWLNTVVRALFAFRKGPTSEDGASAEDGSILSVKNSDPLLPVGAEEESQSVLPLLCTELNSDITQSISIVTADLSVPPVEAALPSPQQVKGLCQQCGKVFQDPGQHYRNVHAKDRPYKCHLCSFSHPLKGSSLRAVLFY